MGSSPSAGSRQRRRQVRQTPPLPDQRRASQGQNAARLLLSGRGRGTGSGTRRQRARKPTFNSRLRLRAPTHAADFPILGAPARSTHLESVSSRSKRHPFWRFVMKNPARFLGVVMFLGMTTLARASDPIGIYALVDRVVFEPDVALAERIQIWGAFALATGRGEEYAEPAAGYMYFSLPEKKAEAARKEWADLKKLAGTGKCLAFAGRYQEKGKVRRSEENAKRPDVYPIAQGVTEMRARTEYPPIKALLSLPVPLSPADGADTAAGSVILKVRAVAEK